MFQFLTIDDFPMKGKLIGVRVDINSPLYDGKITLNERIKAHAKTISDLRQKGAKVVLLAHQGRKGKSDFISLQTHAELLGHHLGTTIGFSEELYSEKVVERMQQMNEGDILLLENLRFFDDEEQPDKSPNRVKQLAGHLDYYVFDAFSVSHRSQTSVIGINQVPVIAGRVMQREVEGLNKIEETPRPHVFLFGGAKPEDLLDLMERALSEEWVDTVLLSGVIGEAALSAKGYQLGKKDSFLTEHLETGTLERIRKLLETYPEQCRLPLDLAYHDGKQRREVRTESLSFCQEELKESLIQDVGKQTIEYFGKVLSNAGSVYVKGPAGNFEEAVFAKGTRELFEAIQKNGTFAYMGGGHTVTAAYDLGYEKAFSHISLAGGALVRFLSGKSLPGVEMLEKAFEEYEKHHEDFVVVGSNCIDTWVKVSEKWEDVHLGDKIKVDENPTKSLGGGGVNVSLCLHKLGAKVGYLGKHTQESYDWVHTALNREGVICLESEPTDDPCAKSVLVDTGDDDRVIFTYRGQNSGLHMSDFDMDSFNGRHYYFTSLGGESFQTLVKMAERIKKRDRETTIGFNPSLYLIKNEKQISKLVSHCDVLVLNLEEAQYMSSQEGVSDCLRELSSQVRDIVVITDGSRGAYAYDGKKEFMQKSLAPDSVVDTTGAGDCFAATFYFFYMKGFGVKRALYFAARNAASVVTKKGAQPGQLQYKELVKA